MGKGTGRNEAFGGPGIPPRWTQAAKDGVGTAYASSSRLWFTTLDDWGAAKDSHSTPTALGIEYLDIDILPRQGGRIRFTFFWTDAGRWEGKDFEVAVLRS